MFGGVSLSHDTSAKLTDSKWSVFEGDEYKSSPTDPTAKFFYYKPTHLLLELYLGTGTGRFPPTPTNTKFLPI